MKPAEAHSNFFGLCENNERFIIQKLLILFQLTVRVCNHACSLSCLYWLLLHTVCAFHVKMGSKHSEQRINL
jgi:hypothetical protein